MATVKVYLDGGPCDGTTKTLTAKQFATYTTTCKGERYTFDAGQTETQGKWVFVAASGPAGGGSPSVKAPHAQKGWQDMQHSLSKNLPAALNQSRRFHAATLRTLGRTRKVRH